MILLSIEIVETINSKSHELGLEELFIRATMGLHPHDAKLMPTQKKDLEELLREKIDVVSGIGETGFDLYYNNSSIQEQIQSFEWQLDLSKQLSKTLVVHTRDAWPETFDLLDSRGWPEKFVLHCFTGGPKQANRVVENGGFVSISGISTFKNGQDIRDAIAEVPLERLLVETDSPWLAPVPYRGKPNEPSYVSYVVDQVVAIRGELCGESRDEVEQTLFNNAKLLFS